MEKINRVKCCHCGGSGEMEVHEDDTDENSVIEPCIMCNGTGGEDE